MGDVTVTAADVRPLPGALVRRYDAGETITPGQYVYLASDGDVNLADADASASSMGIGVAVAGPDGKVSFASGDAMDVVVYGPVAGFSSLTPGAWHYASTTAGAIATAAPAGSSGDYVWVAGYAESAAVMFLTGYTYDIAAQ